MNNKIIFLILCAVLAVSQGAGGDTPIEGRTIFSDFLNFILGGTGGGYGEYYPGYPQRPGYPVNPGVVGPPGAHPGCPLCDSSVYSYCSRKQAHDACCCDGGGGYFGFNNCRYQDCNFLYAKSCEEYLEISNCCCVDVQPGHLKAAIPPVQLLPAVVPIAA